MKTCLEVRWLIFQLKDPIHTGQLCLSKMTKYDRFYVLFWNSVKVLPTMSLIPCLWHLTVLTVLFQYKCIPPTGVTMKKTANSFERRSWVIVTITYNFMLHKGIYIVIYLVVFIKVIPCNLSQVIQSARKEED